jgi:Protein of unknown function (DUF3224)
MFGAAFYFCFDRMQIHIFEIGWHWKMEKLLGCNQLNIVRVTRLLAATLALTSAVCVAAQPATAPNNSSQSSATGAKRMSQIAEGAFDVKMVPQSADPAGGESIARMLLDKRFHGALDAVSRGQMLAMRTAVEGSAGYVAMEVVTGKLDGRQGSFVLQHSGTMNRGAPTLTLTVVPDSGTGELAGLSGSMAIDIAGGKHSYRFDYSLVNGK